MPREADEFRILVPLADVESARGLIKLAGLLVPVASGRGRGRVIALSIVEIPEEVDFSQGVRPVQAHRQRLGRVFRMSKSPQLEVATLVRVSREIRHGISDAVQDEQADLLLVPWKGSTSNPDAIFGTTIDEIVKAPPCDLALVRQGLSSICKRILLPVRGGPHAALALRLATGLAMRSGGTVTALRIIPPVVSSGELEREKARFDDFLSEAPPNLVHKLFKVSNSVVDGILEEARLHDAVVMGAAVPAITDAPHLFGPIAETVARESPTPVIMVKTRASAPELTPDIGGLFPAPVRSEGPTVSTVVDKWFAENTFDSREWQDLDMLVRMKQASGLTISLALPALNEEQTIGQIIFAIKSELMDRHPLLDEMVLVDSRSTDRTVEIARDCGIPVYVHQEILPEYGAVPGKGEALWKSLLVTKGDLVAWIDTDIRNIHPRFVYGLLGPLLAHPRVQYVKGFYRRPIRVGRKVLSTGGGRVTELTARPLLNLFYPELSGVVQPLAGEYAGRRDTLEKLPFFTGYGVETGLLIDCLRAFGLHSIGQVDLKRRVHRNQSLASLSKMAFTLIQVVLKRLEDQQRLRLLGDLNRSMKLIQQGDEHFYLEVKELVDQERPPMITIPEYRQSRGLR